MMPMIRVDEEIYEFLNQRGRTEDTFNDVLRRELGLGSKKRSGHRIDREHKVENQTKNSSGASSLTSLVDKHLPAHWRSTRARGDQILRVVTTYLRTPKEWDSSRRELSAAQQVANELGVEVTTVQDKCTRQLFGDGAVIQNFRAALEAIEADKDRSND